MSNVLGDHQLARGRRQVKSQDYCFSSFDSHRWCLILRLYWRTGPSILKFAVFWSRHISYRSFYTHPRRPRTWALWTNLPRPRSLLRYCVFGVSPVNSFDAVIEGHDATSLVYIAHFVLFLICHLSQKMFCFLMHVVRMRMPAYRLRCLNKVGLWARRINGTFIYSSQQTKCSVWLYKAWLQ